MIFPKKKKKVEKKEETTSNVVLGSLYDMNKGLVEKSVPDLTAEELESKKTLVADFLKDTNNKYYMLLCNDRKDYTWRYHLSGYWSIRWQSVELSLLYGIYEESLWENGDGEYMPDYEDS